MYLDHDAAAAAHDLLRALAITNDIVRNLRRMAPLIFALLQLLGFDRTARTSRPSRRTRLR